MKYILCLIALISFSVFSQDVIFKKDGSKIDAKVIEITTSMIKYKLWDQQDGPLRNIAIKDVKEIVYNDGTWDNFENVEIEEEKNPEERSNDRRPPGPPRPPHAPRPKMSEDPLIESGFFIDFLPGFAITNYSDVYTDVVYNPNTGTYSEVKTKYGNTESYFKFGLRLGTKWYFGASETYRLGLQANWVEFSLMFPPNFPEDFLIAPKLISIGNIGVTNAFKFNDNIGMEANLTTGYNIDFRPDLIDFANGIALNPEVKFRYKMLAAGLGYRHVFGIRTSDFTGNWDIINLSIGLKF